MDVYLFHRETTLENNPKGVKPMTFRKNMHDGIKICELEERRDGRK